MTSSTDAHAIKIPALTIRFYNPHPSHPGSSARPFLLQKLFLLQKAGYSTERMDALYKKLGTLMNERSGKVVAWLASGVDRARIPALMDRLREKTGQTNQQAPPRCT